MSVTAEIVQFKKDVSLKRTAGRIALAGGVAHSHGSYGDFSGNCAAPVDVYQATSRGFPSSPADYAISVPCRKCEKCLQFRQMRWRERIMCEMMAHRETWFLTLTFSEPHLLGLYAEASLQPFESPEKCFERVAYHHVQNYLKRLRNGRVKPGRKKRIPFEGAPFRYFAVMEYGDVNGREHFHLVLHPKEKPFFKDVLKREWQSRVDAELVRDVSGAATYISKYLTKTFDHRPHASNYYGLGKPPGMSERLTRRKI